MCGGVVNADVLAQMCSELEHARRRKNGDLFCTGCGSQLRTS
jgi:hypothetical protein